MYIRGYEFNTSLQYRFRLKKVFLYALQRIHFYTLLFYHIIKYILLLNVANIFQEVQYFLIHFIGYTICPLYSHINIYCKHKNSRFSCIQFHIYLLFINHIYFFSQVSYILFSSQIYEFLYATLEKYLSDSLMLLEGCVMRYMLMCINELQCLLQPYKSFYML